MPTFNELFPHLSRPSAPPEFVKPSAGSAAQPRQKVHRIVLESIAAEAGSTFDNAVFNLKQAPWLMHANLDVAPVHWELRMENFSFLGQGTATRCIVEVRLEGGVAQMESYHTGRQGPSDVIGIVKGTSIDLQSTPDAGIGAIAMVQPLRDRVRIRFQQVGTATAGMPVWAGTTSPYWTITLAMTPVYA